MTEILSLVFYDDNVSRWRWAAGSGNTGFVSETRIRQELETHIQAAQETMQALTSQLYSGNITLEQWQLATASELKDAHLAQAMFGAGGRQNMTPVEWGRVGSTLRQEYGFLNGFAQDIADGKLSEAQSLNRITQYGNDTGQSYWKEWQIQRDNPEWSDLDPLSRVPQDGSTVCRGNCKCFLDERDSGIWWVQTTGETGCGSCADMAAGSPYRPATSFTRQ